MKQLFLARIAVALSVCGIVPLSVPSTVGTAPAAIGEGNKNALTQRRLMVALTSFK